MWKHVKFFMYQVRKVKGEAFKTVKLFIFPCNVHTVATIGTNSFKLFVWHDTERERVKLE